MQKVGTVKAIWRYPVKGMAGEAVEECFLGAKGLEGDRILAVQDVQRQEIQSCKFRPDLLKCRATWQPGEYGAMSGGVEVTFPNGQAFIANDANLNQCLSELVGHPSVIQNLKPFAGNEAFYRRYKADAHTWLEELKATFEREEGEPLPDLDNLPEAMQTYVAVPGTFFLVAPFHIITTASLRYLSQFNSAADWNVERFRPNLVVETEEGMEGLVERTWINKQLFVGDAKLDCVDDAPRCGAVTKPQANFSSDTSILRTIVKESEQNLGVYCSIGNEGVLNVGDAVYVD